MKRSTGIAIALAAGVLVLAGNLPRLPWEAFAASWRTTLAQRVVAWPRLDRRPVASALPVAVPHRASAPPATATHASAPRRSAVVAPAAHLPVLPHLPALPHVPTEVLVGALLGTLAGLATLALVSKVGPRDRRERVFRLARHGHSTGRIARRAHVPQDAVRTLLSPGIGARR